MFEWVIFSVVVVVAMRKSYYDARMTPAGARWRPLTPAGAR